MRLALAALALLIAPPAVAQRVDTRRIDIEREEMLTRCQFNAVDNLTLFDIPMPGEANSAIWRSGPDEEMAMYIVFQQETDTPGFTEISFQIPEDPKLVTTRLYLDDQDLGHAPSPDHAGEVTAFNFNAEDQAALVERLPEVSTARLDTIDAEGKLLHSYSWNVFPFRRIAELLDLVHWQCESPDRG